MKTVEGETMPQEENEEPQLATKDELDQFDFQHKLRQMFGNPEDEPEPAEEVPAEEIAGEEPAETSVQKEIDAWHRQAQVKPVIPTSAENGADPENGKEIPADPMAEIQTLVDEGRTAEAIAKAMEIGGKKAVDDVKRELAAQQTLTAAEREMDQASYEIYKKYPETWVIDQKIQRGEIKDQAQLDVELEKYPIAKEIMRVYQEHPGIQNTAGGKLMALELAELRLKGATDMAVKPSIARDASAEIASRMSGRGGSRPAPRSKAPTLLEQSMARKFNISVDKLRNMKRNSPTGYVVNTPKFYEDNNNQNLTQEIERNGLKGKMILPK